jgi:sortase (surface protein transpeptidase)
MKLWWAASFALVAAGAVLVVLGFHGPRVGPSIPGPIGKTSPSGIGSPAAGPNSEMAMAPSTSALLATLPFKNSSPFFQSSGSTSTGGARLVSTTSTSTSAAPTDSSRLAKSIARSRPLHISIPAIGLSDKLSELGLNKNGTVQVPTSWYVPGWYRLGPSPGQKGSAVILGHVDSIYGPAAFYRLADLRPGNKISVALADGKTVRFKVIGLRMYLKTAFPRRLVYGPRSYSALQLVTCGGVFDSGTHHYLSNLVVFTELVKS